MQQEIRFCTTSDGVEIAYADVGEGTPLVYVRGWPEHLELEWENPFGRSFLNALTETCRLIRYDMRGTGLSDRSVSDFSLEALERDLEAVIAHLKLDRFVLLSFGSLAGPISVRYAAAQPDRVTHLVFRGAFLRGAEITSPERQNALIDYAASFGFPLFQFIQPGDALSNDELNAVRRAQQEAASPKVYAEILRTLFSADVTDLTAEVSVPALVFHDREDAAAPFDLGRKFASRLPNARFFPYEGPGPGTWQQIDILVPEIQRFIGLAAGRLRRDVPSPGSVHTILFTDVEGSTPLTQRLGDARAREVLREHERIVREALKGYGGSEVKSMGDGFMASFPSATRALECAVAIQRETYARNQSSEEEIRVRIGVNAGEPIAEQQDLFGSAVIRAARIADLARGGEILVANVVRELAEGKEFLFSDHGEAALRGFDDPVRLFELRWQTDAT